jgi:hypothetical protein
VKIRLAPEILALLVSRADRRRRPMAEIAREALTEWLERQPDVEALPVPRAASAKKPRPLPRTRRLDLLRRDLRQLLDEYTSWQSNLPEFAADSPMAERLAETVDALETAADTLEYVEPPRGYGRD